MLIGSVRVYKLITQRDTVFILIAHNSTEGCIQVIVYMHTSYIKLLNKPGVSNIQYSLS